MNGGLEVQGGVTEEGRTARSPHRVHVGIRRKPGDLKVCNLPRETAFGETRCFRTWSRRRLDTHVTLNVLHPESGARSSLERDLGGSSLGILLINHSVRAGRRGSRGPSTAARAVTTPGTAEVGSLREEGRGARG